MTTPPPPPPHLNSSEWLLSDSPSPLLSHQHIPPPPFPSFPPPPSRVLLLQRRSQRPHFMSMMSKKAAANLMAEVASSSSDESSNVLSFPDRLTGRCMSLALVADGKLRSPAQLYAQIKRPLELMQAAAWFYMRQSPDMKRHRDEPPPPLGHMLTQFSPCVPVRVMCGCVATACRRLATAPAGVHVMYRTTGRWAARIMERVTRGRVKKVQVRLQRRAFCAVRCACRASVRALCV
jgi:hypothetical protein